MIFFQVFGIVKRSSGLHGVRNMEFTKKDRSECAVHLSEDERSVVILDQRALPNDEIYITIDDEEQMYDAIKTLAVRGAPAIGIFAAYGIYVLSLKCDIPDREDFYREMKRKADYLVSSRPTAVNLSWAVNRMSAVLRDALDLDREKMIKYLRDEAISIHDEDMEMCRSISEYGLSLVKPGDGILTHCNAGALATSKYGTALGPILLGKERGIEFHVFADETRPLLQGARLTSYELSRAGVDVTLICDNMASMVMKNGWVQACFVGCDRVAANGDFANKIGTSGVAILAKHYNIPFYVLGPVSTIDMSCKSGSDIEIELRCGEEIKDLWYERSMAPSAVKCFNPAFDVTDHSLVTAIVTNRGIVYPPFDKGLKALM